MRPMCLQAVLLAVPLMIGASLAYAHGDPKPAEASAAPAEQTEWGIAGRPVEVSRTITLDMTDAMRFAPDHLLVQEGDTVRFVARNRGRMLHEMVIGTPDELARHAALMAKFPGMEHDAPHIAHVDPGRSGEIVWHFNRPGSFEFACLIAGHYEAGMRGTLTVIPRKGAEE